MAWLKQRRTVYSEWRARRGDEDALTDIERAPNKYPSMDSAYFSSSGSRGESRSSELVHLSPVYARGGQGRSTLEELDILFIRGALPRSFQIPKGFFFYFFLLLTL
jgi:hypothetical protein